MHETIYTTCKASVECAQSVAEHSFKVLDNYYIIKEKVRGISKAHEN